MSISKYIEEFNASIEKIIQKRVKKAEENPYPTEEIAQLREQDPESAIAKMFDENGEILAPLFNTELMAAAIEEDKDLYRRLRRGDRAKKGLKNNEYLESLDAEEYLHNVYSKFISKVAEINSLGTKLIDPEEILTSSEDDFLDAAYSSLDIDLSYVNDSTVQSALLEKYQSSSSPEPEETEDQTEISPINIEDEIIEEQNAESESTINPLNEDVLDGSDSETEIPLGTTDPLNDNTSDVQEETESLLPNVSNPELNEEISKLPTSPQIVEVSQESVGEPVDNTNEVISGSSSINNEFVTNISNADSTTNNFNDINNLDGSILNSSVLNSELIDVVSNNPENQTEDTINSVQAISDYSSESAETFNPFQPFSASQLAEISKVYNNSNTSMISGSPEMSSQINNTKAITNDQTQVVNSTNLSINSEEKLSSPVVQDQFTSNVSNSETSSSEIGVSKNNMTISNDGSSFSNIKSDSKTETDNSSNVSVTEVSNNSSTSSLSTTNNNENNSNDNSSQTTSTSAVSSSGSSIDITKLETRLKRIEGLLSSPLNVKLID